MGDIIHLLPENVANQIAAGEVVQRPSSVIKELVENSVDAGATEIKLVIRAAGKNLIQVIDNGKGMSRSDAITAFERHATSKISLAEDLSTLCTMGFRGEALASIASVAQVELVTKRAEDEVGTRVCIAGGNVESVEDVACNTGANFAVKNIFYNVTARRKFLKNDNVEFSNIEQCFYRIALVYPEISFELYHNDKIVLSLPATNLRTRISNIFSQKVAQTLIPISADASIVKIDGFVGKPENARKRNDRQYFFVNGRYMDNPYFRKAILQAYDRLLQDGTTPDYFIYLTVDPSTIDVNVSPTKTEVKFENDTQIFPIISSAVREVLGKFNMTQPIDFDVDVNSPEMAFDDTFTKEIKQPTLKINHDYNPFDVDMSGLGISVGKERSSSEKVWNQYQKSKGLDMFEAETGLSIDLTMPLNGLDTGISFSTIPQFIEEVTLPTAKPQNVLCRYIMYNTSEGVLMIDQNRAHRRVLYERYKKELADKTAPSQLSMLADTLVLTPAQSDVLDDLIADLNSVGYDLQCIGKGTYSIAGIPSSSLDEADHVAYITSLVDSILNGEFADVKKQDEIVALALSKSMSIPYGKSMGEAEMRDLTQSLFLSSSYSLTPDGKRIFTLLNDVEIKKFFD